MACVHGRPGEGKGRGLCPVGMCRKDSVYRMKDRRSGQDRIQQGRNLKKHGALSNSGRYGSGEEVEAPGIPQDCQLEARPPTGWRTGGSLQPSWFARLTVLA